MEASASAPPSVDNLKSPDAMTTTVNPMKPVMVSEGLSRMFSKKQTSDMNGKGLVSYVIFMDARQLTKVPKTTGCCGFVTQCCLAACGQYDYNRLIYMRETIFPKLDGPVLIADMNSKEEDDSFRILNNIDKSEVSRRVIRVQGGLFQKNTLYKQLPKETHYVPLADWPEEQERSEIAETVQLMQAVGAIAVDWEHTPCAVQISDPTLPMDITDEGLISFLKKTGRRILSSFGSALGHMGNTSAAKDNAKALAGVSSLSGRVMLRSNSRPAGTIKDVLATMAPSIHHVHNQPALMAFLEMRMARGIMMSENFVIKHMTYDASWLAAIEQLQTLNIPPGKGLTMSPDEFIECGYRSGKKRSKFETRFTVVFPDCKDGREGRMGGSDQFVDPPQSFYSAGWHPDSAFTGMEAALPSALVRALVMSHAMAAATPAVPKDGASPDGSTAKSGNAQSILSMIGLGGAKST